MQRTPTSWASAPWMARASGEPPSGISRHGRQRHRTKMQASMTMVEPEVPWMLARLQRGSIIAWPECNLTHQDDAHATTEHAICAEA